MIDQLYRKAVLTVAERPEIEKLMRQRAWPLAQRFVAGSVWSAPPQAVSASAAARPAVRVRSGRRKERPFVREGGRGGRP